MRGQAPLHCTATCHTICCEWLRAERAEVAADSNTVVSREVLPVEWATEQAEGGESDELEEDRRGEQGESDALEEGDSGPLPEGGRTVGSTRAVAEMWTKNATR